MTTLYQQFNAALQRRLEANLVIAGELVATEGAISKIATRW